MAALPFFLFFLVLLSSCDENPQTPGLAPLTIELDVPEEELSVGSLVEISLKLTTNPMYAQKHVLVYVDDLVIYERETSNSSIEVETNLCFWADGLTHSLWASAEVESGAEAVSDSAYFTIPVSNGCAPSLLTPSEEALFPGSTDIPLSWERVAYASEYQILLSRTADFAASEFESLTNDTSIRTSVQGSGWYFWKVRGRDIAGTGPWGTWSNTRSFATEAYEYRELASEPYGVVSLEDGGFAIGLRAYPNVDTPTVVKLDGDLQDVWQRNLGPDWHCFGVLATGGGGVVCCGSIGRDCRQLWISKLDAVGDELWMYVGTDMQDRLGGRIQRTKRGSYIVSGVAGGYTRPSVALWEFGEDGDLLWRQLLTGRGSSSPWYTDAYDVAQMDDGGYLLCGGNGAIRVIRTTRYGREEWRRSFGYGHQSYGRVVLAATDGGAVLGGWQSGLGALFMKIDGQGREVWWHDFFQGSGSEGMNAAHAFKGAFLTLGRRSNPWLSCIEESGDATWVREIQISEQAGAQGLALEVSPTGEVLIVGSGGPVSNWVAKIETWALTNP